MNTQPDEPRFTEFMIPLMDAVEEVKTLAEDVTEAAGENGTPNSQVEGENLKRDHARLVLSVETQLAALKGVMQTDLTKEQHEELKEGVKELSDLLLGQLKVVCNDLEKALPEDVVRLKGEHDEYFNRLIPEFDKLKVDLMIKKPSDTSRPAQYRAPEIGEGALVQ